MVTTNFSIWAVELAGATGPDGFVMKPIPMAQAVANKWQDALSSMEYAMQSDFLYVERSYRQVTSALGHKINPIYTVDTIVDVAGSIMDWLGAMRTFLNHNDRKLANSDLEGQYKAVCSAEYDANFAYRFLYRLRNYAQHYALPVHSMYYKMGECSISLERDALLEQYDGWGTVKKELVALKSNEINMAPMIDSAMKSLLSIAAIIRRFELDDLTPWVEATYREFRSALSASGPRLPYIGVLEVPTDLQPSVGDKTSFHLIDLANLDRIAHEAWGLTPDR